jgi:predicted transcriptional regulator
MENKVAEMLDEVQDDLKLIANSSVRIKILMALIEGPKNLSELRNSIFLRSTSILNGMNDLEKRYMVLKRGDKYHLSSTGKIMGLKITDMIRSVAVTQRYEKLWNSHDIEGIPDELCLEIGSLIHSELLLSEPTNIYRPHMNFTRILSNITKFRGVSPVFHQDFPNLMIKLISGGVDTQLIVTENISNKLMELATQDPETFSKIRGLENFELWVIREDVKVAFTVTDQFLSLGLVLEDGTYDYSMDLVSYDINSILWGEKLFNYYRYKSKRVI